MVTLLPVTEQFATPALQDNTIEFLSKEINGSKVLSPGIKSIDWVAPFGPSVSSGSANGAGGGATVGV